MCCTVNFDANFLKTGNVKMDWSDFGLFIYQTISRPVLIQSDIRIFENAKFCVSTPALVNKTGDNEKERDWIRVLLRVYSNVLLTMM